MTHDELHALEDVTPTLGYRERIEPDGKRVFIPLQMNRPRALLQRENDGHFIDANGVEWMTGWIGNRHVRSRVL